MRHNKDELGDELVHRNHGVQMEHKTGQERSQHEHKEPAEHKRGGHHEGHKGMVEEFRGRFWISLALTAPVLILSPMIQRVLGLGERIRFSGDLYVFFAFSSFIFFYGGYPFIRGFFLESKLRRQGMMTLIATAYVYRSMVVFGLEGKIFFWELAILVDIMLLGHWIEMKSVMRASRALEELASLMPPDAHKVTPDGTLMDVPLEELEVGDVVLVKLGEKIRVDGVVEKGERGVNESMLTGWANLW